MKTAPTRKTYLSLDHAYDHFNRTLFGGQLPTCLITKRRHRRALGYFSPRRFVNRDDDREVTDEIALEARVFGVRTPAQVLSTLVHEMVHLWQFHFGTPSRSSYHNKEWAARMREIGLIPSDTGQPGGKATGQSVSHYIEPGGRFERACDEYLAHHPPILYRDAEPEGVPKKSDSKTKYTCPDCGLNAWAKPDVSLVCGDCREVMIAQEPRAAG
jgi:hypothetical protein